MTYQTMVLSEPHTVRPGFITKYYATIDVAMSGSGWHWRLIDSDGQMLAALSSPFPTEEQARDDALRKLNGDGWE